MLGLGKRTTELVAQPYVFDLVKEHQVSTELYPNATQAMRAMRDMPQWQSNVAEKLALGAREMKQVGNLYTASLPAWLAAGLQEAVRQRQPLDDSMILTVGYGSGDAAEIIPMRVVKGWQEAASKIQFSEALLDDVIELDERDYQSLHDRGELSERTQPRPGVFHISRIGTRGGQYDDSGLEYYEYSA